MQRPYKESFPVLLVCLSLVLVLQGWIGSITIYAPAVQEQRGVLHEAILSNTPPAGKSWSAVGGRGTNVRVASVYVAEGLHRATGVSVSSSYRLLDTLYLLASLLLVYAYLRFWFEPAWSLAGLLLLGSVLPLTYFLHYFHPWDRPSFLAWTVLLLLIRADRFYALCLTLPASIAIKYDSIVLPLLYLMTNIDRTNRSVVLVRTCVLFLFSVAAYVGLTVVFPVPAADLDSQRNIAAQLLKNWDVARQMSVLYPPLIGHLPLFVLACFGWRAADSFGRRCVVFSLVPLAAWVALTNFAEVRAQTPLWLLLLPAAVAGLRTLTTHQGPSRIAGRVASADDGRGSRGVPTTDMKRVH